MYKIILKSRVKINNQRLKSDEELLVDEETFNELQEAGVLLSYEEIDVEEDDDVDESPEPDTPKRSTSRRNRKK